MEKTSMPEHIQQRGMDAYERNKMLRVQENKEKLRDMGVKNIADSLTSLVESHKSKKRKEKLKAVNENDSEYIPNLDGVEEGSDEESAISARLFKKISKQPKFIPPMLMKKYATLIKKHRIHAPGSTVELQLGMHSMEEHEHTEQVAQNDVRKHLNGTAMTIGEMISQKKRLQQKNKVLQEHASRPSCDIPNISSEVRRKLPIGREESVQANLDRAI